MNNSFELVSNKELHARARDFAAKYNLSAAYDAHYLALAQWMQVDLWTADLRLVNSLKSHKLNWVKGIEWKKCGLAFKRKQRR